MSSTNGEIIVRRQGTNLSVSQPIFDFNGKTTITWVPDGGEDVQDVAVRIAGDRLPDFRSEAAQPNQFKISVTGAPNGSWKYLLLVDGRWFSVVGSFGAQEPEEPPELTNPPG